MTAPSLIFTENCSFNGQFKGLFSKGMERGKGKVWRWQRVERGIGNNGEGNRQEWSGHQERMMKRGKSRAGKRKKRRGEKAIAERGKGKNGEGRRQEQRREKVRAKKGKGRNEEW